MRCGPAYLEIEELEPGRVRVLWKQPAAGGLALPIHPRLPASWRELPGGRARVGILIGLVHAWPRGQRVLRGAGALVALAGALLFLWRILG